MLRFAHLETGLEFNPKISNNCVAPGAGASDKLPAKQTSRLPIEGVSAKPCVPACQGLPSGTFLNLAKN